jgi:hypothetical protein
MSETIVPQSAVAAAHPSDTPLISQTLPRGRDRLKRWPASCEVRLDIAGAGDIDIKEVQPGGQDRRVSPITKCWLARPTDNSKGWESQSCSNIVSRWY